MLEGVTQLVECVAYNDNVLGSSPSTFIVFCF